MRSSLKQYLIVVLAISFFVPGVSARAAMFNASNAADLVAAINAANATPGVDVIQLTADITLSAVDNVSEEANGLPVISTPLILLGNGHSISRDAAAPVFRFFNVHGAFFGNGELTLDDVILSNGDITPASGGNCFSGFVGCGGAVLNYFGRVVVRNNTRFSDNRAYAGGAIFNAGGKVEISDALFDGNQATLGAVAYNTGGLIGDPARITIRAATFLANTAEQAGGAIHNAAQLHITDSTFTGNSVTGVPPFGGGGGAIYNTTINGDVDIANSGFTDNEAIHGGALSNYNASDMTLRNVDITGNRNNNFGSGGGIWSDNNTELRVYDSRINDNRTDVSGFGRGGGIYSGQNNRLTLENSLVMNNVAANSGGGIYMSSSNTSVISAIVNSRVDVNTASGRGGGIYKEGASPLSIVASSISDNLNNGFNGGGLAVEGGLLLPPQGVRISDSTIARNVMLTGDGGGISNENQGVIFIERSTIADNQVTGVGGVSGLGGGIYTNQTNSAVTVINSTIDGNYAQSNGGGVYNSNASLLTLAHVTVTDNVADLQGGGIHALTTLVVTDSIIAANQANHPVNPLQPNCGGVLPPASLIVDGGGNFTDGNAPACPPTFNESAVLNLQALADNGGPTLTRALGAGSSAIDGGSVCADATDQRGVPRDVLCDSGAWEGDVVVPTLSFATTTSSVAESPGGPHAVHVTLDNTAGTIAAASVDVYVGVAGSASASGRDFDRTDTPPLHFGDATWPAPGTVSAQTVNLDVLPDFLLEGDETVQLTLSDAGIVGPADPGAGTQHSVTIHDAQSDLQVSKSVALSNDLGQPGVIEPGDAVTYTVTLSNLGPHEAQSVTVEDVLDAAALDVANASTSATLGLYDPATGEWSSDGSGAGAGFDLLPGQSETLLVTAEVLPGVSGTVQNTAALSHAFPPRAADPDASNNAATVGFGACEATPPLLEVSLSPDVLWPPEHQLVEVAATVTASDDAGTSTTVTLVSVTSNEPDDSTGDGHTDSDIVILDDTNFQLRSERIGRGSGRVYTVTYRASDECGNTTLATATVTVPRSQGK